MACRRRDWFYPQDSLLENDSGLIDRIKQWYAGKIIDVPKDPEMERFLSTFPTFYVQRHWTAKVARALVGFYLRYWAVIWPTLIAAIGAFAAVIGLT